ncbi:BON domain-containing protein [Oceanicoccus sagamiensis]|uniref:Phospholipid-binding protein n=1 Tax=Oceanicoccus sagamiensis TaxID=716816 RepID=A0A1X9NJ10_9GAMM|nr:BON domain-containing protein [Oceanicoccus sagamiensis]ARN74877.1 phospholipid-binding protein [Oceanicoccus sagamiensis]
MKTFFSLFFIALLTLTIQGCSSILSATTADPIEVEEDERTTGSALDDEIIETVALVNLDKADEQLAQANIVVVSFNGVVLLAGQVNTAELRILAAETVAKINKVRRVHNEITVSGTTTMVARSNDSWITTKVKTKLLASSQVEGGRIKVVTENGVVYLLGLVTKDEAARAAEIARTTGGVQKVVRIFEYI